MNESSKTMLRAVLSTLNQITVNGRNNIDMLLGCILTLEKVLESKEEDNGDSDG